MWLIIALLALVVIMSEKHYSSATTILAGAIAEAEGYAVSPENFPTRNNNPGDIEDVNGVKQVFATATEGWLALFDKLQNALDGNSSVYPLNMTFAQLAATYTGLTPGTADYNDWLQTVLDNVNGASGANITPDTTLGDYYSQV